MKINLNSNTYIYINLNWLRFLCNILKISYHFTLNFLFFLIIVYHLYSYDYFSLDTKEADPCYPSPCGPNAVCEKVGNTAICKCLPGLQGIPTSVAGCHPECVLSSDCSGDKACIQNKCRDPCSQNVCGSKALCKTINHSPLCSCPSPLIGNPFEECYTKIGKCRNKSDCEIKYINFCIVSIFLNYAFVF